MFSTERTEIFPEGKITPTFINMSKHVFENLLIKNKTFLTTVQATSATGIIALTSGGSQSLQIADSGDVTLFGPQHTVYNNFQKIDFVGAKDLGSLSGNLVVPLYTLSMPQNTQVGFKTYISLTSRSATLIAFEEYYGVALNTNGSLTCQINQLATSPVIALDPANLNITGDPSMGTGLSNVQSSSLTTLPITYNVNTTGSQTSVVSVDYLVELLGPTSIAIARL